MPRLLLRLVAAAALAVVLVKAQSCPIVKTEIESWDLGLWDGISAAHQNRSENTMWNVTMCQFVFSSTYEWGNFEGTPRSVQFHEPSDTFYMYFQGGDKGEGCAPDGRQTDVFFHCQQCPDNMMENNCHASGHPCICAAWEDHCVAEVHMTGECPVGVPKYREGFDIFDASTGINVDVSKVVVKDGQVLAPWRDETVADVATHPSPALLTGGDRAVIPRSVAKAVFFLMMSEKSTESTDFDPPDIFTDQSAILQITADGSGAHGGTVTPNQMQDVVLHFKCLQSGLANVHVEISFAGRYYPCDFAFVYECSTSTPSSGGSVFFSWLVALVVLGCVLGYGYNYKTHGKTGLEAVPGIEVWQPLVIQAAEAGQQAVSVVSAKVQALMQGGGRDGERESAHHSYQPVASSSNAGRGFQEEDDGIGII